MNICYVLTSLILVIFTAAIEMLTGQDSARYSRKPDIVSDAAYFIITKPSRSCTGNFFIDESVVRAEGITDLTQYACDPSKLSKVFLYKTG